MISEKQMIRQRLSAMISGVRSSQIWQEGDLLHLRLDFEEGLEREYVYHVVPAIQNEKVKA